VTFLTGADTVCNRNAFVTTEFEDQVAEVLDSLPDDISDLMSNVAVVVEDEPPAGLPLLGLYRGVPLTRRTSWYGAVAPDKITIYQGPIERHFGHDPELLRSHEIAHHFGISDERLREIDRY
jgi:predicted Zn-dependent protease with MMP-like domain